MGLPRQNVPAMVGAAVGALLVLSLLTAIGCSGDSAATGGSDSDQATGPAFEPSLVCRVVASHELGLVRPKGLAIGPDGRLYVAHAGGVAVFDAAWSHVADLPTDAAAVGVAVHEDGRLFVAEHGRVLVFSPALKRVAVWDSPAGTKDERPWYLTGIAVHGPDVWLADFGNRVIHRYDTTGDYVADFGGEDPARGVPGIVCPSPYLDCAVADDGTLYVGDPGRWQVEHYDLNGRLIGAWGRHGLQDGAFQGCCNPTNLALLPGGRFATSEKGTPRVTVWASGGEALGVAGPENFHHGAAGIDLAVDAEGRLLAVDPLAAKVIVFSLEQVE